MAGATTTWSTGTFEIFDGDVQAVDTIDDKFENLMVNIRARLDGIYDWKDSTGAALGLKSVDSGWIRRSDWTNVHLGSVRFNYDGKSSTSSFTIGEVVSTTDGYSGTVMADDGGTTGELILRLSSGTSTGLGNNITVTGADSGITAAVNEGSGTKNQDANFYHGFGVDNSKVVFRFFISSTGGHNGSWEVRPWVGDSVAAGHGISYIQVDTNNIKIQTAATGFNLLTDTGGPSLMDTENWFYKVVAQKVDV
jgi:hypothetical protein